MPEGDLNGFSPSGFDRATGLSGLPGTPTPPSALISVPNTTFFEELPESPEIERGEQATFVHRFKCDYTSGVTYIQGLPRGEIMTDSFGNQTKILSSKLELQKGQYWMLTVIGELLYQDVPPDEFNIEVVEFNPSIFRHPRYADLVNYEPETESDLDGSQIITVLSGTQNLPQVTSQAGASALITSAQISNDYVLALAQELQEKLARGFDTFYMAGFKVTYSSYYYLPPDINPGGYIEDPVASGSVPSYFWSDDGSGADDTNIFTTLSATVNPALYADGISWLRYADYITYQRTWFKLTNTWVGAPFGVWDADIYSPTPIGEV